MRIANRSQLPRRIHLLTPTKFSKQEVTNQTNPSKIMKTMAKGVTTMGRLADKNILITGGNSGIGLAAAQKFDREGARVAICGLNEGALPPTKEIIRDGRSAVRREGTKL